MVAVGKGRDGTWAERSKKSKADAGAWRAALAVVAVPAAPATAWTSLQGYRAAPALTMVICRPGMLKALRLGGAFWRKQLAWC